MFRVLTRDGKKISSLSGNTEMLLQLSKQKHLICPYCKEEMQFVSATQKRPYFRHLTLCTYVYHDSESEEHDQGKELLAKRLKELFPESIVELEEGVRETHQISDVMVIHPNGERWAFEFQCYPLTNDQWKTRHNLYKKTGIYDLGFKVNGYITTENAGRFETRIKNLVRSLLNKDVSSILRGLKRGVLGVAIIYKKCTKCGSMNSVKIDCGMPSYERLGLRKNKDHQSISWWILRWLL